MTEQDEKFLYGLAAGGLLAALLLYGNGWRGPGRGRSSSTGKPPPLPPPNNKGTLENPYLLKVSAWSCAWENGMPRACIDVVQLPDGSTDFQVSWTPPRAPFGGAIVEVDVTGSTQGGADAIQRKLVDQGWAVRLLSE